MVNTIIRQMNTTPGKLTALLGAMLLQLDNGLQINFKGCRKADRVQITLNGNDLYDVTFFKYSKRTYDCPKVAEFENIYADMLQETFEQFTGLNVTL